MGEPRTPMDSWRTMTTHILIVTQIQKFPAHNVPPSVKTSSATKLLTKLIVIKEAIGACIGIKFLSRLLLLYHLAMN